MQRDDSNQMFQLASAYKISAHKTRIFSYLRQEPIFPVTLELDITSKCTRTCPDCPSSRSSDFHQLSLKFVSNLLAALQGETRGLLLTGGEPTISPDFPAVVRLARKYGFQDIAVVTNGSLLHRDSVIDALISSVSTLRISLYDWEEGALGEIETVLRRIADLRGKIEKAESPLQIGVSALTSKDRAGILIKLAQAVRDAGAHWIYFHPRCTGWDAGCPAQVDQEGVYREIGEYQERLSPAEAFRVFVSQSRYTDTALEFDGYHAAHFLLVIGADGLNYLAPEVKYQPRHVLADVANDWGDDFLWRKSRMENIQTVKSGTYPALRSRHRGVLYNDFIERIRSRSLSPAEESILRSPENIRFPHIL